MTAINENRRFAVLIDADNAQASTIESILAEIARYGTVTSKRCYGDWTQPNLAPWKATLLKFAIQPMQQFAYTKGKNATDSAMIIDAMDLLYTGNFDGFCIVSIDSDFTRLATRLRESGLEVIGFGRKITPEPFRVACSKFTFTEVLLNTPEDELISEGKIQQSIPIGSTTDLDENTTTDLKTLLKEAIETQQDAEGFANLANVGSYIQRIKPDFDPRNYGGTNKKLGDLVKKQTYLDSRIEDGVLCIRFKEVKKT
jgi:uncharacterized LabA/DUF88 family protein